MPFTRSRISFTMHRSGWLLVAVFIAFGYRDLGLMKGVLGGALVVGSLLIHELAHAAAASFFGVTVHGIGIKFIGAYTHRKYANRRVHDVVIAAAGPLSSLLLTLASFYVPKVGIWLAEWNFGIVVLNLLPFPGTDGYRILKTIFWPDAAIYGLSLARTA
jgi:Zn-dependent protease